MKKACFYLFALSVLLLQSSCDMQMNDNKKSMSETIGEKEIKLESDRLNAEVLWALGRIGEVAVSPDKSKVLFNVTFIVLSKTRAIQACMCWM